MGAEAPAFKQLLIRLLQKCMLSGASFIVTLIKC